MARAKTSEFYISESVTLDTQNTVFQTSIDIGSMIDAAASQGLAITEVDFTFQRELNGVFDDTLDSIGGEPSTTCVQLSDRNPQTIILPNDDVNLIATGNLTIGDGHDRSNAQNLYPDNYTDGKWSDGRFVVSDVLYLCGETSNDFTGTGDFYCCVRIRAAVVKLAPEDWQAIALASLAVSS